MVVKCPACDTENRIPLERLGQKGKCGQCKAPLVRPTDPLEVSPTEFDAIVKGAKVPVLVDFWAPWCPPCRMAGPQVAKAAKELGDGAVVLKVNTQDHPELGSRFKVNAIPHFMVLKRGEVAKAETGFVPAAQLVKWVKSV